jgi:hypothetical protein
MFPTSRWVDLELKDPQITQITQIFWESFGSAGSLFIHS